MVLLLRKLYLYFNRLQRGSIIFHGGGVSNFFQGGGVQMLISIENHIRTCYFPGVGCQDPYPSLDPHMGKANKTRQYLLQFRF